ncbi:hypothetical protein [Acaryochloris sp. IP29b_bin.148]|uniref:hypothetical protein n=1 Tax=Acaryochloris sp. IP29b_bin.148 TaxID=2969218 RepID=UPI0026120BC1|nr:hypothetical protein [Acaryochloris sp. IP29b_bin.148]
MSTLLDRELFEDNIKFLDQADWLHDYFDDLLEDALNSEDGLDELDNTLEKFIGPLFSRLKDALRKGQDYLAVRLAIQAGNREENKLTNMIFFAHHPERRGQAIRTTEPNAQQLIREWLNIRNHLVRPALQQTSVSPPPSGNPTSITYKVLQGREYGGKWKSKRPPGLPSWVRQTSARGAALPHVQRLAQAQGLGIVFVQTIVQMARTESGGTFALPANNFDARPPKDRPLGKGLITAWGVFQFNRDAWTPLFASGVRRQQKSWIPKDPKIGCQSKGGCVLPWGATTLEEIALPIRKYAELFRNVKIAGGSNLDAARGLRLWHISPAAYRKWLNSAKKVNFNVAWLGISQKLRKRVGIFLNQANVL